VRLTLSKEVFSSAVGLFQNETEVLRGMAAMKESFLRSASFFQSVPSGLAIFSVRALFFGSVY
jgi:hypothetical protein